MRVFISGATGVLGRRVVNLLVANGYEVVGHSRSSKKAEWLSQHGAEPRQGEIFSLDEMRRLTDDCDAILHLATAIPTKRRTALADWATNDRLRREGTQVLVEAALHNHCKFYLQESVTFVYGDRKGESTDEDAPISSQLSPVLRSAVDMEKIVQRATEQRNLPATILRFGMFYCHDSALTQAMLKATRKGLFPVIGAGSTYCNLINVDDAAMAILNAVENYSSGLGQIFNVCDDEPVTYRELLNYIAQILGARKPMSIPVFLAKWMLGAQATDFFLASARCRNQRIKEKLGWKPHYPTYREGYRAEIDKWLSLNH
jgi:nucleoside-diphosphate-sugar epimerase